MSRLEEDKKKLLKLIKSDEFFRIVAQFFKTYLVEVEYDKLKIIDGWLKYEVL